MSVPSPPDDPLRSAERFRLAAEVTSDLIYEWEVATDALDWFGDVDAALGYTEESIPRTIAGWVELIHPEDVPLLGDAVEHHRTSTEPISYLYRVRHADGTWHWWEDRGMPVLGDDRMPVRWVGSCRDVTERKSAEERLRQSEERMDLVLRAARLGTWEWDLRADKARTNDRLAEILGYEHGELSLDGRGWLDMIHPDDRDEVARVRKAHFAGGDPPEHLQYRLRARNGAWVWVLESGQVTERDEDDRAVKAAGAILDVTDRIHADAERDKLQAQLQQAQKMESLGVLAGGIAHDFNNMLTGMLGGAELALMDLGDDAVVREHLQHVRRTAQQASELCRQLLAYSGKGRFVVQPLDISHAIEEMQHLLEVSVSKKAVLRFDLPADLPRFEADVSQLRQIILNLVINASEALEEKSGIISIAAGAMRCDAAYLDDLRLDEELSPGDYVWLEVSDTGAGMDAETRGKIFDPFFSTKFTGRGLGLAATLGIVRGHRGAIKVYSEPGRGTTFKVLFPVVDLEDAGAPPERRSADRSWRGSGTILLVDDEETVRAVGRRMLERLGFEVRCARDGREGVEMFEQHADEIDLVLLDMTMPRLNGEEAFREIRRIRADVRVILMSGYNEQEAIGRFAGKGLAGFMQKPLSVDALRAELRTKGEQES